MKIKLFSSIGIILLTTIIFFTFKGKSFKDNWKEIQKDLHSYILKGTMQIAKGEGNKTYQLEVGYQKEGKGLYKVSLYDKELQQKQEILRNKDGVFVITPSLNQIFKFEGDWPSHHMKPYLIQSMDQIMNQKNSEFEKKDKDTIVKSKVSYPSNKNYAQQEMCFDENGRIKWLVIYNSDRVEECKIVFHECKYNVKIPKNYFRTPTNISKKVNTTSIQNEDLPLYPMQTFDAKLKNVTQLPVNGEMKHFMEYKGEKSFTLIQTKKQAADKTQTVMMPGEMMDNLDLIGVYDDQHFSMVYHGVEFSIYSQDLQAEEMMEVMQSLQVVVMK